MTKSDMFGLLQTTKSEVCSDDVLPAAAIFFVPLK